MPPLRALNLNLLPILRTLLQERGVSRAAHGLGLSPAATSEALAQLRVHFADPLLVRVGAQMVLTPRAEALRERVEQVCTELEDMLSPPAFEPAEAARTFVVSTTDHYVYLFGQALIQRVAAQAPRAKLHFVPWTADAPERMAAREIDLCLMPRFMIDDLASPQVRVKTLFSDRLVLIFASQHPLAGQATLRPADLAPYRQILFTVDAVEDKRRRSRPWGEAESVARVWPLLLAPLLLPGTDHLSVVPWSLAVRLARDLPLQWREWPAAEPEVHACVAWSTVVDADAGHRWFRGLVAEALQAPSPSPPPPPLAPS